MRRNVEGRLAKLEGTAKEGARGKHIIFAMTEKGETLEEFEARVERQKRALPGNPDCDVLVFELITSILLRCEAHAP